MPSTKFGRCFCCLRVRPASPPPTTEQRAFSGLELPDIICDVIDPLMPELKPYELSFYVHFLRHSIIEHGKPYIRVSRRGLQSGIVKSAYAGSTIGGKDADNADASFKTVRLAIEGLEKVGAIRQEGEPNRDGTLYRVQLPKEIEVCQRRRAEQAERPSITATERQADFYDIRENRLEIYERDNYHCTVPPLERAVLTRRHRPVRPPFPVSRPQPHPPRLLQHSHGRC